MTQHPRFSIRCSLGALVAAMAVIVGATGCGEVGRKLPPPEETYALTQGQIARTDYRLQIGDRLDIKFPYQGRFNQDLPVRPDGKITLEATGEIVVEGMTPHELEEVIKER